METKSDLIFKIYKDIIENYQNFVQRLKSSYPSIIVDVISIIVNKGIDTKGTNLSSTSIEEYYYQLRKQQETTMADEEEKTPAIAIATTSTSTSTMTAIAPIHNDEVMLKEDSIESLARITNRGREELQESLAKLQDSDLKRIRQICYNYGDRFN